MALLGLDGFEYSTSGSTYTGKFWPIDNWQITTDYVRTGNQSAYALTSAGWSVANKVTLIVGFALYNISDVNSDRIISFYEGATEQCYLFINSSFILEFKRGDGTILATGTTVLQADVWYYIEVKVTINNSTGAVEVRLNGSGSAELSASGVDTQQSSNAYITKTKHMNRTDYRWDDIYICDDQGSDNNDFLGDCGVDGFIANAAGDSTQWTPSTGSNYQNVDETQPDDDSTYNYSSTAAQLDLYNIPAANIAGTIFGIQLSNYMRKDDAGARTVKNAIKIGSTTDYGSNESLADSYLYYHTIWENNPDDAAAWEDADIDSLQIGAEIVS